MTRSGAAARRLLLAVACAVAGAAAGQGAPGAAPNAPTAKRAKGGHCHHACKVSSDNCKAQCTEQQGQKACVAWCSQLADYCEAECAKQPNTCPN